MNTHRTILCGCIAFTMLLVSVGDALGQRDPYKHNVVLRQFRNLDKKAFGGQGLADFAHEATIQEFSEQAKSDTYLFTFIRAAKLPSDDKVDDLKAAARKLHVDTFIEGEIVFVKITNRAAGILGLVEAGVKIRIRDAVSGDLVNGAAEVGVINFIGDADVSTVQTAVENAVKGCVGTIQASHMPEGIITFGKYAWLLNRGFYDGVKLGMLFAVYRGGAKVGVVKATGVFGPDTELLVKHNLREISLMDSCRALYTESRNRLMSIYAKAPPVIDIWS